MLKLLREHGYASVGSPPSSSLCMLSRVITPLHRAYIRQYWNFSHAGSQSLLESCLLSICFWMYYRRRCCHACRCMYACTLLLAGAPLKQLLATHTNCLTKLGHCVYISAAAHVRCRLAAAAAKLRQPSPDISYFSIYHRKGHHAYRTRDGWLGGSAKPLMQRGLFLTSPMCSPTHCARRQWSTARLAGHGQQL